MTTNMNRLAHLIDQAIGRVEHARFLDRIADAVSAAVRTIVPAGPVKDLASGTPTAHPLHPPLTDVTIGTFSAATVLDLAGGDARTTRRLIGLGVLAALPTVYAGASDWAHTSAAERRVGLVHASVNALAVSCFSASWLSRRRGRNPAAVGLSLGGCALLAVGGSLGGHLAYGMGVGVDTTAFQHLEVDWTDVAAESDVPGTGAIGVQAAGLPVLLARHRGAIVALADRCTHRGGPLHEGTVDDGCVQCPWHGSRFRLADGSVDAGPATRPQPVLRTRVVGGRVQVSRVEERSLRTRPVH
jgi:nitrite reductase/ring-hydroxylating ferredoxin subunit/uncharacterized membrane protein